MSIIYIIFGFTIACDVLFAIMTFFTFIIFRRDEMFFYRWYVTVLGILNIAMVVYSIILLPSMARAETLCMRLNNPMCITGTVHNPWNGQVKLVSGGLVHFKTMDDGLRAGAIVLRRYKEKHKINTLERLVTRYARGNRTNYEKFLRTRLRTRREAKIDIVKFMPEIMAAIITMENGRCIFSESDLKKFTEAK